jgi:hypothetical protein
MGIKKAEAMLTRTAAVATGPNSTVLMRMNKNEAPQRDASSKKSRAQGLLWAVELALVNEGLQKIEKKNLPRGGSAAAPGRGQRAFA